MRNRWPRQIPIRSRAVLTVSESPIRHRAPAIRYLHFPVRNARPIPIAWLNSILTAIEENFHEGPVLVHCSAGLSRSPSVIAAFLDRVGFLSFPLALRYLENIRPAIAPSPVLVKSIAAELTNK
jgi:protein-tyrosine phosphatase